MRVRSLSWEKLRSFALSLFLAPIGIVLVPAFVVLILGVVRLFAHPNNPMSLSDCVWSASGCSSAAATWLLFLLAIAALLPAVFAYRLEAEPIIHLCPCKCKGKDNLEPDLYVTVDSDGVHLVAQEVQTRPEGYDIDFFEFENLGRSPARSASTSVRFGKDKDKTKPVELYLGPIPEGHPRHVAVCVNPHVLPIDIEISRTAKIRSAYGMATVEIEARSFSWIFGQYEPPAQPMLPGAAAVPAEAGNNPPDGPNTS